MGWHNPPIPWSDYERLLRESSRPGSSPPIGAGPGDSPAWSIKRAAYQADPVAADTDETETVSYAELHSHSSFSFLDGVSSPEALVAEAARVKLHALALTDHNGLYGAVRFAEAAHAHQVTTVYGAELSLAPDVSRTEHPDPPRPHLLVLARGTEGYYRLASALTDAHLASGEKGRIRYDEDVLGEALRDHVVVLTGCRKGAVRQALQGAHAPRPAQVDEADRQLAGLVDRFGRDSVVVELFDHQHPLDSVHNDVLAKLAAKHRLATVATGIVHYARPEDASLAHMMAAIRSRRSLEDMRAWLPPAPTSFLRSGWQQYQRFHRYPGAISHTVTVADECAFSLKKVRPELPRSMVPEGHTSMSYLRHLIDQAIPRRYPGASGDVIDRIERELALIEKKGFAGYFLIVHDIVQWARQRGILCQGRGSAANSAICFLLDITAVDSIYYNLPFERFLSALRDEEPDIDVDFEANRREEVIQYVYQRYGRKNAAQVATVIEYRPKNAVRDVARALGFSPGQQDALSAQIERRGALAESDADALPDQVVSLARRILTLPRHLGIHSGGMVLTDRPIGEVVPIEHARKSGRTVVQWDKDDCEWMGLVKFDLLGLGILEAIQHTLATAGEVLGEQWELATIPRDEPGVYDMLCRADSIGVFQVESRAQMALLPRLQPREFYHLAIQIAMIRPGPIQGGAVHPFVRRKAGLEPVEYLHPKLESCLQRTLGVPIFQEQIMQIAMAIGGCTGEDADLLRRAMGSKRGIERIERLRDTLYAGMADNGIDPATADRIYSMIQAFASFGFAESHSLSFALLVYASAWLKLHYPAIYLMGLLRAWPMGFYSPGTLVADAERHGVAVFTPCVQNSEVLASVEPVEPAVPAQPSGQPSCCSPSQSSAGEFDPSAPDDSAEHRRDKTLAVRLGLASIDGIGADTALRIVTERGVRGEFAGIYDLTRRVGLTAGQVETLAAAGACDGLGVGRREALWLAGPAATARPDYLHGTHQQVSIPLFSWMSDEEIMRANRVATGVSPGDHPLRHLRPWLEGEGVLSTRQLATATPGRRVWCAGLITHRQRPATAGGITFVNLEDEYGLVNVVCSVGMWRRYRLIMRHSPAAIIRGTLQRSAEGVLSLLADGAAELPVGTPVAARDFH